MTVLELIDRLANTYGLEPRYTLSGEFRPGDVRHLVHDASAIRALGWAPETSLDAGLEQVVAWIAQLGELKDYFSRALDALRGRGVVMRIASR